MQKEQSQSAQIVIVRKDRESKYDQNLIKQWREARSTFFLEEIHQKLAEAKADESAIKQIVQWFLNSKSTANFKTLKTFDQYQSQVEQLNQRLQDIQKYFTKKERECQPMTQIIQRKITSLKRIHIQYQSTFNINNKKQCPYSVSAFELFKIVHLNKLLTELTIKKVFVQQSQLFMKILRNLMACNRGKNQSEDLLWMKDFNPSKALRLSINTELQFDVSRKEQTHQKLNDFTLFKSLFRQICDITVQIKLGLYNTKIKDVSDILLDVWSCIRKIKKIKLIIQRCSKFSAQQAPIVRSILFGELASFTEISQLSIIGFGFSRDIRPKDFIAMQQSLNTLFQVNPVTNLTINSCSYFPIIPRITTLQSINLSELTFRKHFNFMSEVLRSNLSLKSIKCYEYSQKCQIGEQLINQLQTLSIDRCPGFTYDISSLSPSNIQYLSYYGSEISNLHSLFPKLFQLAYLELSQIDFTSQMLRLIPSPYLEELIYFNTLQKPSVTNQDLLYIDSKWPSLRNLQLYKCLSITESVWNACKFKGLKEMRVDLQILGKQKISLHKLKSRGIKVDYW